MDEFNLIATTTFGLEATVKREALRRGYKNVSVLDGRVDFTGTWETIADANLWLRSADRVLILAGSFEALSFDELFEKTKALPWEYWLGKDAQFVVTGKSVRSKLFSVSDCQSIVKKAIVEKLKQTYSVDWFAETGPLYKIQIGLLKDQATITIDTTGPGLHKRGYREGAPVAAPLKETLAAALIELSYWKKDRIFFDPVCGSGTLAIEAALMARNIAPGISRTFVSETWPQFEPKIWRDAREKAHTAIDARFQPAIFGSDIDPASIRLAKQNAMKAGVDDAVVFETKPLANASLPGHYGVAVCNPPYGERIGERQEVEQLYKDMGSLFRNDLSWSVYVITSKEDFEKYYGKKADAKRKLYNGMIKTDYFQFFGARPKKEEAAKEPNADTRI